MTQETQNAQVQTEQKQNDKELNFRALEAKYQRQLEAERQARLEAERKAEEARQMRHQEPEEDDSDPYVDHKKLDKKLNTFERKIEEKIDKKAEEKARSMLEAREQEHWMNQNSDFYDVMQHANAFAERMPGLANSILRMPDSFERQKLVYENIKALGLHKPAAKEPSIQEKVDQNRRSPYYQPSGVGTAPYSNGGDFSPTGQKQAYAKMQELKNRLRI